MEGEKEKKILSAVINCYCFEKIISHFEEKDCVTVKIDSDFK